VFILDTFFLWFCASGFHQIVFYVKPHCAKTKIANISRIKYCYFVNFLITLVNSKNKIMLRWLLLPFSFFYGLAVWLRNKLFDVGILPSKEFEIPLIVVGNITVGGTGKTPHIEYLANLLSKNKKVAVLSRGYKRKSKGFVVAHDSSTIEQVGDEPRQIKRKFPHIAVAVHANRVSGIHKLMHGAADFDPDVILLDDAFQHRYVKAGLNILLVDYNRPLETDYL
jgi:tetraacyldisaccharide 4'-kinase